VNHDLLVAVLAGGGAMLGWGLADFFAKLGIDRVGSLAALVWAHLFGAVTICLAIAAHSVIAGTWPDLPDRLDTWLELAAFGIGQACVYLLVYRGFEKGRLAVLNPIFSAYAGMAALLAILFFGDVPNAVRIIALIIVFAGVMTLSADPEVGPADTGPWSTPGLAEIVVATALAAAWTVLWDQLVSGRDWWTLAGIMYLCMSATLLAASRARRVSLRRPGRATMTLLAGIGAAEALAYLSISVGFSTTSMTSVVALLSGAFPIPALILARRYLQDRLSLIHSLGAAAVIGGTALLVVGGS
jgi:uncharacterized membrane protein